MFGKPSYSVALMSFCLLLAQPCASMSQSSPDKQADVPVAHSKMTSIRTPVPLNSVEAEFPLEARATRDSGKCIVKTIVDAQGIPQAPAIVRCSDPIFEKNSLEAVKKYRFHPARNQNGVPVPVMVTVEVNFSFIESSTEPLTQIKYILQTPPGVTSADADANGVYPFTNVIEQPKLTDFSNQGFIEAAEIFPGGAACDLLFTITSKGKVADPQILHCDKENLEQPAIASLLKSRFRPGKVQGKKVAVRTVIHLSFGGFQPKS